MVRLVDQHANGLKPKLAFEKDVKLCHLMSTYAVLGHFSKQWSSAVYNHGHDERIAYSPRRRWCHRRSVLDVYEPGPRGD